MKLDAFCEMMESVAPKELALSFDNVGLLIGPDHDEIKKVLVALDLTVPVAQEPELMKRLLRYAQPELRPSFKLRVGYLAKSSCALFAARLSEREVTLPALNEVFTELWRLAEDFRRRIV